MKVIVDVPRRTAEVSGSVAIRSVLPAPAAGGGRYADAFFFRALLGAGAGAGAAAEAAATIACRIGDSF